MNNLDAHLLRAVRAAIIILAVLLTACGGDSPTAPPPAPPPSGTPQTISGSVVANGTSSHPIEVLRSGTLSITLTWSNAADLNLYLTAFPCATSATSPCAIHTQSATVESNREAVDWNATAGEKYTVRVENLSATGAVSYTIVAVLR